MRRYALFIAALLLVVCHAFVAEAEAIRPAGNKLIMATLADFAPFRDGYLLRL